jgi:hypothetical protein
MQSRTLRLCSIAAPMLAVLFAAPAALAQASYAPPAPNPPPPPPPPQPVATSAPAEAPAPVANDTARPVPFTLGLGAGTVIGGTSVLAPNAASARFVLTEEWQLEPLVNLSLSGTPNAAGETDNTTTIRAGGLARYVYASNGPVDIQILGGALLGFVFAENVTTIDANLSYGASVVWYLSEHWSISGDATNPIITLTNTAPDEGDSVTSYTIGAIWNPTFSAMLHIYM